MRLDDLYLVDIIEAHESIISMMDGASFKAFKNDEKMISAIQMKLVIMGEALSAMQSETRDALPDSQVSRIRYIRNRIVHGYFTIDVAYVYGTATRHAPKLAHSVEALLEKMFPDTYTLLQQRRAHNNDE